MSTLCDETLSKMEVLRRQEETTYHKTDYLGGATEAEISMYEIDANSRTLMVQWCNQVIDYCHLNRETSEIAMSFVDRFIATSTGSIALYDRSHFQLACMTALYTAIKLNEPIAIDPKLVSVLSRGLYTVQEIEDMERNMLIALKWHMNPPTSLEFCRELLHLIPDELLNPNVRKNVYELAKQQSEIALKEYCFVGIKPSTVAYCSLINAFDVFAISNTNSSETTKKVLATIRYILCKAIGPDSYNDEGTQQIQQFLYSELFDELSPSLQQTNVVNPTECTTPKTPVREVLRTKSPHSIVPLI